MAAMTLVDGIYYTAEDLAAKNAREAASAERREAEAKKFAAEVAAAAGDEVLAAVVRAAIAPLTEEIEKQAETIEALVEAFGDRLGVVETAVGVVAPAEPDSGDGGAAGADSDKVAPSKRAAKSKEA